MGNSFAGGSVSPLDNSNRRMGYGTSTSPIRIEPQLGPPTRWWDDKKTIKHLALRNDQKQRMDDIFEANRQQLSTLLGNLQREEARLVSLPPGDLQDEGKVFAAIDRVSQARAELEKAHAHILLQIRQQMDSQQLATLDHDMASLVLLSNVSPGRSSVDGKFAWFGESGKCCVSRHNPLRRRYG